MELEDLCEDVEDKDSSLKEINQERQIKKLGTLDQLLQQFDDEHIRQKSSLRVETQGAGFRSDILQEGIKSQYGKNFHTQMGDI